MDVGSTTGYDTSQLAALREQLQAQSQSKLAEFDTNGDGALSADEFSAAQAAAEAEGANLTGDQSSEDAFAQLDADGDGLLTQEEMLTSFSQYASLSTDTLTALLSLQEEEFSASQYTSIGGSEDNGQDELLDALFGDDAGEDEDKAA